ncbi:MAG: lipopolysaccharide biosynthesis protein [Gammaproteobacteria bacterium]
MQDLQQKITAGAFWMVGFRLVERTLGFVSTLILARLLLPEDFGVVAMALSIMAILELLGSFNLDMVLIQKQQAGRDQYDTAWTIRVIYGVVCALLLLLLAYPMAAFYREDRVIPIMAVTALGTLLASCENIGTVDFRKDLRFQMEFKFRLRRKLVGFFTAVPLAFLLQNYWALVLGSLATSVAGLVQSYTMHPYRPRFSLVAVRELFAFAGWLQLNNVLWFLHSKSSSFVIGRVAGASALGVFTLGSEISALPSTELTAPINRAVYPGYARLAHDHALLNAEFLRVLGMIWLLALPASAGIAVLAEPIVHVLLGPNWTAAVPVLQVLAVQGALQIAQGNIGYVLMAAGRARLFTIQLALYPAISLPLIVYFGGRNGAIGAAWGYLLAAIPMVPISYAVMTRVTGLRLSAVLSSVWRPAFGALLMAACVYGFWKIAGSRVPAAWTILALAGAVLVGALAYAVSVYVLWRWSGRPASAERAALGWLNGRLGGRLARA